MVRAAAILVLVAFSSGSVACEKLDAVFENERASTVLSVLAKESGLTLVNPELASTTVNATFEAQDASKLLRLLAWDLGFELRVQGNKAWLHERDEPADAAAAPEV